MDTERKIVFVGEEDVGKTTLINAVLGREVLPPKFYKHRYMESCLAEIRYGNPQRGMVHFNTPDMEPAEFPLEELADRMESLDSEQVEKIQVFLTDPRLANGIVLVDTPGYEYEYTGDGWMEESAWQALEQADQVVVVLDGENLDFEEWMAGDDLEDDGLNFYKESKFLEHCLKKYQKDNVYFVINYKDYIGFNYAYQMVNHLTKHGEDGFLCVNALHALKVAAGIPTNPLTEDTEVPQMKRLMAVLFGGISDD